jgi:hypothetical protein
MVFREIGDDSRIFLVTIVATWSGSCAFAHFLPASFPFVRRNGGGDHPVWSVGKKAGAAAA